MAPDDASRRSGGELTRPADSNVPERTEDTPNPTVRGRARRVVGRAVKLMADTATAVLGPKAEPLRGNLMDLGEGLDPTPPPADDQIRTDPMWIDFHTRVDLTMELTALAQDIAHPNGWAHILSLSLDNGEKLIAALRHALKGARGWQRALTDTEGYLDDVRRTAAVLYRIAQLPEEQLTSVATNREIGERLREGRNALKNARVTIQRLVGAEPAYADTDLDAGR